MSNTAQLGELEGGAAERPWGRRFAGYRREKLTGQIALVDGDRTFVVAFAEGTVVGARSPLATDAAVRVARLANLISPTQVSSFVRKHGASVMSDDVDRVIEHAKLSADQAMDLRCKVVAHRAARTFSLDTNTVMIESETSIDVVAGCALDPRAIIYQGARQNLAEHRLTSELERMGSWFRLKPDVDLAAYCFGPAESALLDKLRTGGSLLELEMCVPGIDLRLVRAVLYTLCATDAVDLRAKKIAASDDEMLAPAPIVEGLLAPKPVADLDSLIAETPDLLAPKAELPVPAAPDLLEPVPDLLAPKYRDRNDTVLDSTNRVDLVGVTVDGRYVLDRKLGEGAMGTVYLAHHTKLDRMFAVKVLHRRLLGSDKSRRRFEREAELSGRLSHHNVVRVVDVGTIHDLPYLAMEFAEGSSLATVLVDAPLPQARTIELLRQLCAGLLHAHEAGLIHRDLKPSNVMVDSVGADEVLRIVDFGIAILNEPDGGERLTTRGVILGTPDYMAPELALGKAIDHRLDLYALGVIAYEMVCGVRPFPGDGVDVALANVNTPAPPMRERAPGVNVDPLLEALARRLLEKDPKARPGDAAEVRRLLDLIEEDRPAAAAAFGIALEPAGEDRAAVKTRAMWQLGRDGSAGEHRGEPVSSSYPSSVPVAVDAVDTAPLPRSPRVSVAPVDAAPVTPLHPRPAPSPTAPALPAPALPVPVSSIPPSAWARPSDTPGSASAVLATTVPASPSGLATQPLYFPPKDGEARRVAEPPQRVTGRANRDARDSSRDLPTDEIHPVRSSWKIVAGVAAAVLGLVVIVAIATRGSDTKHSKAPNTTNTTNDTTARDTPTPGTDAGGPTKTTPNPTSTNPNPDPANPTNTKPTNTSPKLAPTNDATVAKPDTSEQGIVTLYKTVGEELFALMRAIGNSLTGDLQMRFRMLYLPAALQSAPRRAAAHEVLTKLLTEIRTMRNAAKQITP